MEQRSCELFEARFDDDDFVAAPSAISLDDLKTACPRWSAQLSIQELDVEHVESLLRRVVPKALRFWR